MYNNYNSLLYQFLFRIFKILLDPKWRVQNWGDLQLPILLFISTLWHSKFDFEHRCILLLTHRLIAYGTPIFAQVFFVFSSNLYDDCTEGGLKNCAKGELNNNIHRVCLFFNTNFIK